MSEQPQERSKIVPNTFQTPNMLVDELMPLLTGNEVKAYLVVDRKTLGWLKRTDCIALSQIVKYTGTSDGAARDAMKSLCEFGLVVKVSDNDPLKNFGPEYALQLDDTLIDVAALESRQADEHAKNVQKISAARAALTPFCPTVPPSVQQSTPPSVQQDGPPSVQQSTQKPLSKATIKSKNMGAKPAPLDWQLASGQPIVMPTPEQELMAKVDLAVMGICKHGQDLAPLAECFILTRQIFPSKRDLKGWASAFREMKNAHVTAEHITRAIKKLLDGGMTVATPWSVRNTAIDLAAVVKIETPEPAGVLW